MSDKLPHDPSSSHGADPSLRAGGALTNERFHDLLREFWFDDPTETWQPYIDAATDAFNGGVPVVILSGRYGVGKTQLFGGQQERRRDDYWIDDEPDDPKPDTYTTTQTNPNPHLADIQVIHTDEATQNVAKYGASKFVDSLEPAIQNGRQFVTMFPGISANLRSGYVHQFEEELGARGIGYVNLGDVVETHVQPQRSIKLLGSFGVSQETIQLFSDVPPLRTLRLFNGLLQTAKQEGYSLGAKTVQLEAMTPDFVHNELHSLVHPPKQQAIFSYNEIWNSISWGRMSHMLFMSAALTTRASTELYELLGEPLPDPSEFPDKLGYDPYHKD